MSRLSHLVRLTVMRMGTDTRPPRKDGSGPDVAKTAVPRNSHFHHF